GPDEWLPPVRVQKPAYSPAGCKCVGQALGLRRPLRPPTRLQTAPHLRKSRQHYETRIAVAPCPAPTGKREGGFVPRQPHQGLGVTKLQSDGKPFLPSRCVRPQADGI